MSSLAAAAGFGARLVLYRRGVATALYRRYRSMRFGDLVGQDVIARTLGNEVRDGNIAHAYLFTGIRGTGKTSTARILARAVNCSEMRDGEPCNRCDACREILDGSSVDVLEIDAASNRGIDEMRTLRERVGYLPSSLRTKVYIIDEAHMLTTEAWNAFLKTLEEPPAHVLFILATTAPDKIPDTVRSRVQRFDFRRVSTEALAEHLGRVLAAEGVEHDAESVALVAEAAQGSVRDALSMLDQALAGGERPLLAANARRALGLADRSVMTRLMEALAGADGAGALRAVGEAFDAGVDARQLLREATRLARSAELVALGAADPVVGADEEALVAALARVAPAGFWLRALELMQATSIELRQPVDPRMQVEFCMMRLVREGSLGEGRLGELEARLADLEGRATQAAPQPSPASPPRSAPAAVGLGVPTSGAGATAAGVAPAAAAPRHGGPPSSAVSAPAAPEPETAPDLPSSAAAAAPPGPGPDDVEGWQALWGLVVEAVNRRDPMLAGVLRDCRPLRADVTSLVVGAPYSFHLEKLQGRSARGGASAPELLALAATEVAGGPREVTSEFCGNPAGTPSERPTGTSAATQAVLDAFGGSRVTSTRLRDDVSPDPRAGAH
ncbi:MAG: DNA polymerase III subunit gamma/tau [Candidatus Dormibacteria bacterium]